jgi:hypothetical protein
VSWEDVGGFITQLNEALAAAMRACRHRSRHSGCRARPNGSMRVVSCRDGHPVFVW